MYIVLAFNFASVTASAFWADFTPPRQMTQITRSTTFNTFVKFTSEAPFGQCASTCICLATIRLFRLLVDTGLGSSLSRMWNALVCSTSVPNTLLHGNVVTNYGQ